MIQVDLTDPLPLSLTIAIGTSGLFPRCLVYDESDSLVATRDLTEVGSTGRYTDTGFTPVTEEVFTGHFTVFTNAGHTTESTFEGRTEEQFRVAVPVQDVVVDASLTINDVLKIILSMAAGEFTESTISPTVKDFSFKDRAGVELFVLRITDTVGRTRTVG